MANISSGSLLALLQLGVRLSTSAYSSNYSHFKGTLFSKSTTNDFEMPTFYVYTQKDTLFIIIRGSNSAHDYLTDAEITETLTNYGIFHTGFYKAALYVYKNTENIINKWKGKVFFVGHSYGGSVSQILVAISYYYKQDIDAYAISYGPMPSMYISADDPINERIITINNNEDIVPTLSIPNVYQKFKFIFPAIEKIPIDNLVKKFNKIFNLIKLNNTDDTKLLTNLINSIPTIIRSVQDFSKGVPKFVRYPAGNVYKLKLNRPKTLKNCKINPETDLNSLTVLFTSISDHNSENYLKVVNQIREDRKKYF